MCCTSSLSPSLSLSLSLSVSFFSRRDEGGDPTVYNFLCNQTTCLHELGSKSLFYVSIVGGEDSSSLILYFWSKCLSGFGTHFWQGGPHSCQILSEEKLALVLKEKLFIVIGLKGKLSMPWSSIICRTSIRLSSCAGRTWCYPTLLDTLYKV